MRELTQAEINNLQMYVDYVRELGGKDVGTKAVYDLMHPNDSYSYSYGTKGKKISKAFQKADQYGYLDVKWDGRRYLASLPLTNKDEPDRVDSMFPSKEEMEARANEPKDIVALYQAAIDSVPDGPFKDGLKLGKDQVEEEKRETS